MHQFGDAGIHGAAQHQQGAILHVIEQGIDAAVDVAYGRIQVPVHRRPHHRNHRIGLIDTARIESCVERLFHDAAQQFVSPTLHERHGSGIDQADFGCIDVQQVDLQPSLAS